MNRFLQTILRPMTGRQHFMNLVLYQGIFALVLGNVAHNEAAGWDDRIVLLLCVVFGAYHLRKVWTILGHIE